MDDTNNSEVRHHGENINFLPMTNVNCILIVFKYNYIRKHKSLCTSSYVFLGIITMSDSFLQKKKFIYTYIQNH